mmetsp:Transcript_41681/g.61673  ORF Transcript_41681/g.61673 Transcript_41681/m.61673 type:complete len:266 (+) Transcript_41681:447-1244(+)
MESLREYCTLCLPRRPRGEATNQDAPTSFSRLLSHPPNNCKQKMWTRQGNRHHGEAFLPLRGLVSLRGGASNCKKLLLPSRFISWKMPSPARNTQERQWKPPSTAKRGRSNRLEIVAKGRLRRLPTLNVSCNRKHKRKKSVLRAPSQLQVVDRFQPRLAKPMRVSNNSPQLSYTCVPNAPNRTKRKKRPRKEVQRVKQTRNRDPPRQVPRRARQTVSERKTDVQSNGRRSNLPLPNPPLLNPRLPSEQSSLRSYCRIHIRKRHIH